MMGVNSRYLKSELNGIQEGQQDLVPCFQCVARYGTAANLILGKGAGATGSSIQGYGLPCIFAGNENPMFIIFGDMFFRTPLVNVKNNRNVCY